MISMRARLNLKLKAIKDAERKAGFKNLGHAGAAIRLTARRSIRRSAKSSAPGRAPHTRKGQLKRSLRYAVEKTRHRVLIGPAYSVVGRSGMAHEFGGKYRRNQYPTRPFMGPALKKQQHRLPKIWQNSIK
jgi:phage gpG-like protein